MPQRAAVALLVELWKRFSRGVS